MKSLEKLYTFYRPIITTNEYGDRKEKLIPQQPIKIWISDRDIVDFTQLDLDGLKWNYIGITKDKRLRKNDFIDEKQVIYTKQINNIFYVYLIEVEGRDDSE